MQVNDISQALRGNSRWLCKSSSLKLHIHSGESSSSFSSRLS